MSEAEVAELLGCPAGEYTSKAYLLPAGSRFSFQYSKVWAGPRGVIEVIFDRETEKVDRTEYCELLPDIGWCYRIRGWLGRLLGRKI
jgi:hypothetical protein